MSGLIEQLLEDPSSVLGSTLESSQDALRLVKAILDPITSSNSVLDEIYTEGLDSTQVWGQVKLVVDGVNEKLLGETIPDLKAKFGTDELEALEDHSAEEYEDSDDVDEADEDAVDGSVEEEAALDDEDGSESFHSAEEGEGGFEEEEVDDEASDAEEVEEEGPAPVKRDAFGLNDGFFDIDEFSKQVLAQEDNNGGEAAGDDDEEEIDYFADLSGDEDSEEEEAVYHNDFFKPAKKQNKKVRFQSKKDQEEEEEEIFDEDGQLLEKEYDRAMGSTMLDLFADEDQEEDVLGGADENLSTFEKQQRAIQKEIAQLEQEAVAEKKWALKGESKAVDRPGDALLAEDLEFERTAKPVPVITKDVTESIEEIIRRRIKEQQFDELEKKSISELANFNKSRRFELSEEKSAKSLSELYEEDYKGGAETATDTELEKAHAEVAQLFQSLTHKLDALSSAHFVPKPAQKALDVKVESATIAMEDAQPLTLSNSTTLAPQELFNVQTGVRKNEVSLKSGLVISKDELAREEKQRLRRLNKRKRSKELKQRAAEPERKKSKRNDVLDTLHRAKNLTVINSKGEKRDVQGNLVKDKRVSGSTSLKL